MAWASPFEKNFSNGKWATVFFSLHAKIFSKMSNNATPQATCLQPMDFKNHQITPIIINELPYFIANEVCNALAVGNSRQAISKLDPDERRVSLVMTPSGKQSVNLVSESGLYSLIFQSRKPEAKAFKKWVTAEVLPAIRQNGRYGIAESSENRLSALESSVSALIGAVTSLTTVLTQNTIERKAAPVKQLATEEIDARHLTFGIAKVMGENIRMIVLNDKEWFSINDVLLNMKVSTGSTQVVKKLSSHMACKIWLYGNTSAAWFCSRAGVDIILKGSRKLRNEGYHDQKGGLL